MALGAIAFALAAWLLWVSVSVHRERACTLADTPYLPICPGERNASDRGPTVLQERIRDNPGDAGAWTRLLVATPVPESRAVLTAAAELAPNHAMVLKRRAGAALEQNRMDEAVDLLVQMLRNRGTAEAGQVLAQIIGAGQWALLRPHLDSADRWLPPILNHYMPTQKIPAAAATPLVAEAVGKHALSDRWLTGYMELLKAGRQWNDAYGLWLVRHGGTAPLLYNAGFDKPLAPGGFDWEFNQGSKSRAGASIEQANFPKRGRILEVEFNGRTFVSPIVRQYMFTAPDTYHLKGFFLASKVKSEGGLVWKVVCPASRDKVVGQSQPLLDTGGAWKAFEFEFGVPPDCGPVASLQLEPAAAFEAGAGIRGRFAFDGFELMTGITPAAAKTLEKNMRGSLK